jgi:hypothetical protein
MTRGILIIIEEVFIIKVKEEWLNIKRDINNEQK